MNGMKKTYLAAHPWDQYGPPPPVGQNLVADDDSITGDDLADLRDWQDLLERHEDLVGRGESLDDREAGLQDELDEVRSEIDHLSEKIYKLEKEQKDLEDKLLARHPEWRDQIRAKINPVEKR
jgi:predicted nuclease with TOPRIM domain